MVTEISKVQWRAEQLWDIVKMRQIVVVIEGRRKMGGDHAC